MAKNKYQNANEVEGSVNPQSTEELTDEQLEALTNPDAANTEDTNAQEPENVESNENTPYAATTNSENISDDENIPDDEDAPADEAKDNEPIVPEAKPVPEPEDPIPAIEPKVEPTPEPEPIVDPITPELDPAADKELDPITPELDPATDDLETDKLKTDEIEYGFSKKDILAILDSETVIDSALVNVRNTEDDIIALDKINKLVKAAAGAGRTGNDIISKVLSQALAFVSTTGIDRNSESLWGTIIREINDSKIGEDFDLLMFMLIRTFSKLRVLSEIQIIKSLRLCKNAELKQAALALSHTIKELHNAEQRKEKVDVTISLTRAFTVSPSGFNSNAVALLVDYFNKK